MAIPNQAPPHGNDARAQLAELAATQFGLVTRRQATDVGLSSSQVDWLLKSKTLLGVHSGVFRYSSSPQTWHQRMKAALLVAGPDSVLSHRSAGSVLRLDGIQPGFVEITLLRRSRFKGVTVHFTEFIQPGDVMTIDNLRITSATRTLIDLATVVDRNALEAALDDALRRSMTSIPRLRWAMSLLSNRRHGMRCLRELVDERDPKRRLSESILETKLLRLIRNARLPIPVSQYEIRRGSSVIARVDFAYPGEKIAIETDGFAFHSGRSSWQRDLSRANELTSLGWRLIRITSDDLTKRPDQIVALIRSMLAKSF